MGFHARRLGPPVSANSHFVESRELKPLCVYCIVSALDLGQSCLPIENVTGTSFSCSKEGRMAGIWDQSLTGTSKKVGWPEYGTNR